MATQLKNILSFSGLVTGTPVSLPHGLNLNGVGVIPDLTSPASGNFTVSADATNVTVTRKTGDPDSVSVFVIYWHSENRVFGQAGTPFSQLAPAPFVTQPGTGHARDFVLDGSNTDVYVDSVNGLDTNDGLSTTTALQSINGVYTKFPLYYFQMSTFTIHLAGVGGFGASATAIADYDTSNLLVGGQGGVFSAVYHYKGPHMVPVTPATGPATAALDAGVLTRVIGGAASAGGLLATQFNFTGAAPGWTAGDFTNKFMRVTRGGNMVIYEAPIANNTADTILILQPELDTLLASPILNTDTVEIVEPGARFINTTLPLQAFDECRVTGVGTFNFDVAYSPADPPNGYAFERIQFRTAATIQFAVGVEFDRCYMGPGTVFVDDSSIGFIACSAQVVVLANSRHGSVGVAPNPDSVTSPIVANRIRYMGLQCFALQVGSEYGSSTFRMDHPLGFQGNTIIRDLLFVTNNSLFWLSQGDDNGYIQGTGTGATLKGIRCWINSIAQIPGNATPGRCSVFGPGGDIDTGQNSGTPVPYGNLVGDFEEIAGYNGHLQKFPTAPGQFGDSSVITTLPMYIFE